MKHTYIQKIQNPPIFIHLPEYIAPDERFVPITDLVCPGVLPIYLISNYGRVYNIYSKKFMANIIQQSNHYAYANLITYNGTFPKRKHRLVMKAFNYRPDCNNLEVNHINGDKADNRLCNLEWCTRRENMTHAVDSNLAASGENSYRATITNEQARQICKLLEKKLPLKSISIITGINRSVIDSIYRGNAWKQISREYNIEYCYKY